MNELIRKQDAIKALADYEELANRNKEDSYDEGYRDGMYDAVSIIEELPSAEPEIIRCKDCVHWKHSSIRPNYCEVWEWCNQADDFCSFAERREEE